MAKIKLGQRPQTYKPVMITFEMPDGSEGIIEITFRYRTRSEFGELLDELHRDAGIAMQQDAAQFSMKELMEKTRDKNVEYLMKCVAGWNLDEELNVDSMRQLSDELPAATAAIMEKYRIAVMEGRLGN